MTFAKNITWSPEEYAASAVIAQQAAQELLSRLQWMTLQPRVILDVGCGAGEGAQALQARYPAARVLALDTSDAMLRFAAGKENMPPCVYGAAEKLPLRHQSVDLIFANFLLPWQADFSVCLSEWLRVLTPNGLLLFTALGPDTLKEWQPMIAADEMPRLMDMHDLGDMLQSIGFTDPVVDVDYFTLAYQDKTRLCEELIASGCWFPSESRQHAMVQQPENASALEVTYEVIYGHSFAPLQQTDSDGAVKIPLSTLRRQLQPKG